MPTGDAAGGKSAKHSIVSTPMQMVDVLRLSNAEDSVNYFNISGKQPGGLLLAKDGDNYQIVAARGTFPTSEWVSVDGSGDISILPVYPTIADKLLPSGVVGDYFKYSPVTTPLWQNGGASVAADAIGDLVENAQGGRSNAPNLSFLDFSVGSGGLIRTATGLTDRANGWEANVAAVLPSTLSSGAGLTIHSSVVTDVSNQRHAIRLAQGTTASSNIGNRLTVERSGAIAISNQTATSLNLVGGVHQSFTLTTANGTDWIIYKNGIEHATVSGAALFDYSNLAFSFGNGTGNETRSIFYRDQIITPEEAAGLHDWSLS